MRDLWLFLHSSFRFGIASSASSFRAKLNSGHTQQEHETRHGSMSRSRWAVDGPEGGCIELGEHKFSLIDDGAPKLCNMVCTSMGRHVHIDDCRGDPHDSEAVHINEKIFPNPGREKDWITHGLHWRRMGEFVPGNLFGLSLMRLLGFKGNRNNDSTRGFATYLSL